MIFSMNIMPLEATSFYEHVDLTNFWSGNDTSAT
jgi:hypothetical protein